MFHSHIKKVHSHIKDSLHVDLFASSMGKRRKLQRQYFMKFSTWRSSIYHFYCFTC